MLKEWTLFPQPIHVQAEDEEEAIARAKTEIQKLLSSNEIEFEDIVDEGKVEEETEIDEKEVVNMDTEKEFSDDESY